MKSENDHILEQASVALPVVHRVFNGEVGVAVADADKILKYLPAKNLDFRTPVNSPIAEGSGLQRLIRQGLPHLTARIGKELHGVPYRVKIGAIYNSVGNTVGALVITQTTDSQERLKRLASMLSGQVEALRNVGDDLQAGRPDARVSDESSAGAIADRLSKIGQELQRLAQLLDKEAEFC